MSDDQPSPKFFNSVTGSCLRPGGGDSAVALDHSFLPLVGHCFRAFFRALRAAGLCFAPRAEGFAVPNNFKTRLKHGIAEIL
jgi:hypothetical protein